MNDTEGPRGRARGWPYVVTGVLFAAGCAWISYNDGLFVTRLAGNTGRVVYVYPLLPDVLIVISLLALREATSAGVDRSGWAVAGLRLGIVLTLAMNIYAGVEHSVLAAIQDGAVPVVFFIAVEIVLWHVRHGRHAPAPEVADPAVSRSVPSTVFEAAKASMAETARAGNPLSRNQLQTRFALSRADADEIWQPYKLPAGVLSPAAAPAPAGALNGSAHA